MKTFFIRLLIVSLLALVLSPACAQPSGTQCIANIQKRLDALGDQADFDFLKARQIVREFDFGTISEFAADARKGEAFQKVWKSLSEFCDVAGNSLSAKGMKGYTRLSGAGIIRSNGTDFVAKLKKVFGDANFDGPGFNIVMEYLDGNGTWLNQKRWRSKAGVLEYDLGSQEGHRIAHVLSHTQAGYKNSPHSVFSLTSREKMFDVLDEGWSKPSTSRLQGLDANGNPDSGAWVVEMGRQVGTQASETKIRYIIKSGTAGDIITAYPVSGLQP